MTPTPSRPTGTSPRLVTVTVWTRALHGKTSPKSTVAGATTSLAPVTEPVPAERDSWVPAAPTTRRVAAAVPTLAGAKATVTAQVPATAWPVQRSPVT